MLVIQMTGLGIMVAVCVFAVFLIRGADNLEKSCCAQQGRESETKHARCSRCAQSVGTVNVIGNILMILIKGYLGVAGRSKGLIADAIHSSADLLATIVMIIGLKISDRDPDETYPYGYGKAEYIVAIVIYLFLLVIGIYIISNGLMTIIRGNLAPPCMSAAWGALFSIAINELMFRQSVCAGTHINSPSMVAKAWESRSDVYSSIAVLFGIIGSKLGFAFMDPLAAMVVGVIILKISIEMVKDSVLNLLDKSVEKDILDDIRRLLARTKSIKGVKQVIGRELGRYFEFELELLVPREISVKEGEAIKREVRQKVVAAMERQSVVRVRLYGC